MATYKTFKDLDAWRVSRELSIEVFSVANQGLFAKDFGLKDQINRATGSIMDNIAEGFGRGSRNEFIKFLSYSKGSTSEVISQLQRALDRQYTSQDEHRLLTAKASRISNILFGLIRSLNQSEIKGQMFKDRRP